ncbi:GNAT family N-acetyltransferase [Nostoc sp. CHAB 5844]|nr:GNAT family N-acetyltransferase [Nostoc sp. CHAB 5844]
MKSCLNCVASQKIFNKLKDQLGFTSIFELSESQIELIEEVGACYYHIRKDEQVTIRKLAVLPEHQRQGWGRLLIYRVICRAIEGGKTSIFLKCPADLSANNFYKNLGFELETTEQDRTRPLNHWGYHIKLPLLFYCGGGGKSKYDAIAHSAGWNLGINSSGKNTSHQHMMMVDNDWEDYKHSQHLEMVRRNKPLIATARDIEDPLQLPEILEQAAELAKYAGRVLLIPKCDVALPENYWLGYSVPSRYGSTPLKPEWFGDRPIHLLGGSPKKQALAYPQMNVISLDANYAQNLATNFCKAVWTDGNKNIERQEQGCYNALSVSLKQQFNFWREKTVCKLKKGDRVCDTFPSGQARTGTILETLEEWAIVDWDNAVDCPNGVQWNYQYLEKLPEKFYNNQLCSHQDTSSAVEGEIPKAQLPQDTSPSGQLTVSDPYACAIYRKRFPSARLIEQDITTLGDEFISSLPTPDIIVGGSPCQNFSIAGDRTGITGSHSSLFFEFIRFLQILQPPAFCWENVSSVLSSGGGQDFIRILDALLQVGYVGTWQVRNGNRHVPQNRERIFCVGIHRRYSGNNTKAGKEIIAANI